MTMLGNTSDRGRRLPPEVRLPTTTANEIGVYTSVLSKAAADQTWDSFWSATKANPNREQRRAAATVRGKTTAGEKAQRLLRAHGAKAAVLGGGSLAIGGGLLLARRDNAAAQVERERRAALRGRWVSKLDTTMSDAQAKELAARYGTRGPLPKGLHRADKMAAYEARYIASGGKKGEKHQRRQVMAEHAAGGATAGAVGSIALDLGRGKKLSPKAYSRNQKFGLASAGIAGASTLYARHQESRARSYRSAPAGVAAGALTRMRDYDPDIEKSDRFDGSIKTTMSYPEALLYIKRYGSVGELPSRLSRQERADAYEARYIYHGGRKRDRARKITGAAQRTATLGGAAAQIGVLGLTTATLMDARSPARPTQAAVARNSAKLLAGGVVAGVSGQLVARAGRKKEEKYRSAKLGTAAGSLRRMRDYDVDASAFGDRKSKVTWQ